jgi:hypothetical protein
MAQLPNAADEYAQPAFLAETGQDVPEGTFATTKTPTTTGTVGGEAYRLGGPGRAMEHALRSGEPYQVTDADIESATLLGLPTMKMEDALRGLGAQEASVYRRALRYMTRAANRVPDEGPQIMAERTAAVQAAADVPAARAKLLHRVAELSTQDVQNAIDRGDWPAGTESWAEVTDPRDPSHESHWPGTEKLSEQQYEDWLNEARGPKGELPAPPEKQRKGLAAMFKTPHVGPLPMQEREKAKLLANWTDRRELHKLGWTPKDVERLPYQRVRDILNRSVQNVGQAHKWEAIEAGKREAARVSAELDKEAKKVSEHLDFVGFLKNIGGQVEPWSNPLELAGKPHPKDILDKLP